MKSDFPFARIITAENMMGFTEAAKCHKIAKVFQDTYKSPLSVVVLDDIERLLEYVPIGHRFSNAILQTLLACLKKAQKGRKLLIIGTTSNQLILEEMQVLSSFNAVLRIPNISKGEEMSKVLKSLGSFSESTIAKIAKSDIKDIPMKKLIMINEMARLELSDSSSDEAAVNRFLECAEDFHARS